MTPTTAKKFASELNGETCNGWVIGDYINNGKSAVVCSAEKDGESAAIKIFDPHLVDSYGCEIQAARIERECSLIGRDHPNLVKILDGGKWEEKDLFFVVMEFLPWRNLSEVLSDVPSGCEIGLIEQLAHAAKYLEDVGLCHRDIKPENIAISPDFEILKLLDFGVIRPIAGSSMTDGVNMKNFVGTLRYSPPEFLMRRESGSVEGWRAITFYQIGAVMHDLLTKKPLFLESEHPYPLLVNAIQIEIPEVNASPQLQPVAELARACLLKKPDVRLQLVNWGRFAELKHNPENLEGIKARIINKNLLVRHSNQPQSPSPPLLLNQIVTICGYLCRAEIVRERSIFPPLELKFHPERNEVSYFSIHFPSAPSLSLVDELHLFFEIGWIDPDSSAITVKFQCVSGRGFPEVENLDSSFWIEIYSGVFEADSIGIPLIKQLYETIVSNQIA